MFQTDYDEYVSYTYVYIYIYTYIYLCIQRDMNQLNDFNVIFETLDVDLNMRAFLKQMAIK